VEERDPAVPLVEHVLEPREVELHLWRRWHHALVGWVVRIRELHPKPHVVEAEVEIGSKV
jgi:hypothetical protein